MTHFLHTLLIFSPFFVAMATAPQLLLRPYRGLSLTTAPVQAGVLPTGQIFAAPQYAGNRGPLQVTWDYSFGGTALGTVNVRLEGTDVDNPQSAAAAVWADADDGTAVAGEAARHVVNKEFKFFRVRVTGATGGDATTTITAGIKFN
jgi:hypothetical protein